MNSYLAVHARSLPYIGGIVRFLECELAANHPGLRTLAIRDSLDEAEIAAPAVVYVIGELLPPWTRRAGVTCVLVNFSVVAMIGNPLAMSLEGARLIRSKRRLLEAKLPRADAVLDYYPAQTRVLRRRLDLPVMGFLPCSDPPDLAPVPLADREFDLCFVGGLSPRRQRVLDAARAAGLGLSPSQGGDLETLSARARLTLNVHMQASNHLEIPRIVGSLSTGTPVLTEHSHGLTEVVDSESVRPARAADLVPMARAILADPAALAAMGRAADAAYADYRRRAVAALAEASAGILRRAEAA